MDSIIKDEDIKDVFNLNVENINRVKLNKSIIIVTIEEAANFDWGCQRFKISPVVFKNRSSIKKYVNAQNFSGYSLLAIVPHDIEKMLNIFKSKNIIKKYFYSIVETVTKKPDIINEPISKEAAEIINSFHSIYKDIKRLCLKTKTVLDFYDVAQIFISDDYEKDWDTYTYKNVFKSIFNALVQNISTHIGNDCCVKDTAEVLDSYKDYVRENLLRNKKVVLPDNYLSNGQLLCLYIDYINNEKNKIITINIIDKKTETLVDSVIFDSNTIDSVTDYEDIAINLIEKYYHKDRYGWLEDDDYKDMKTNHEIIRLNKILI